MIVGLHFVLSRLYHSFPERQAALGAYQVLLRVSDSPPSLAIGVPVLRNAMDFNNASTSFASGDSSAMDLDVVPVEAPVAGVSGNSAAPSGSQGNSEANGAVGAVGALQRLHLSNGSPCGTIPNPTVTLFYEDPDNDSDSVVEKGRMVRTGYVFDPLMMLHCADGYEPTEDIHDSGEGHPEEPMRIKRIFNRLKEQGLIRRMKRLDFTEAQFEQVRLVHTDDHWMKVQGTESELDVVPCDQLLIR